MLTSLMISSEWVRGLLQHVFAHACVLAVDYSLLIISAVGFATLICVVWPQYSSKWTLSQSKKEIKYTVVTAISATSIAYAAIHESVDGLVALMLFLMFFSFTQSNSLPSRRFDVPFEGNRDADVVIIGAGTAGAALAHALAKQNRQVVVIEKNFNIQDRIVGELMQPGGLQALRDLNLLHCALGSESGTVIDSVETQGYVLVSNDPAEQTHLAYPERVPRTFREYFGIDREPNGTDKPFGCGFHNGRFVQRLREELKQFDNVRLIQGTASNLIYDKENANVCGVSYKPVGETESIDIRCPLTIACDGMWSSLRRHVLPNAVPSTVSNFVGLLLIHDKDKSPVPSPYYGHVVLAKPSPILMYQISSTETRVLVDVPDKVPRSSTGELEKYFLEFVAPQLPSVTKQSFIEAVKRGDIRAMPNRYLVCNESQSPGVFLLGDSFNMRHPLTGSGMTVALKDVVLLESLLKSVQDFGNRQEIENLRPKFFNERKQYASTINVLANALYHVFSSPGDCPIRRDLRNACYSYLHMGGMFSAGPIGLLSALTPKPLVLVLHFFMVAVYAMYTTLFPFPTLGRMQRCWKILHLACVIIMPLLEKEQVTILSVKFIADAVNLIFPFRSLHLKDFK